MVSSPGQSLEPSIQRAMEDKMGDSFGDVRVHTGPRAAEACDQINARAFTVGNHVAFNHGEYDPESAEGQHVIAHELAHVRQQTGGAVSMLPAENVELEIDPDPRLEEEAEETAQRVMAGGKLDIQRMHDTEVHVQRKPEEFAGLEIDPDPKLEEEAEDVAQRVMADGKLDIQRLTDTDVHVQRYVGDDRREAPTEQDLENWEQSRETAKDMAVAAGTAAAGRFVPNEMLAAMDVAKQQTQDPSPELVDTVANEVMDRINQQTELDLNTSEGEDPLADEK